LKLAGYFLIGTAIFAGLCILLLLPENESAFAIAGLILLSGSFLVLLASIIRVMQGKVTLKPRDAMKIVTWIFLAVFGIRFAASMVISGATRDIGSDVFQAAIVAIVLSLHSTAYRRPE
jgi:hypothetical protein